MELLTTDEIAEKLKMKKSWIYSKTRTGEIPHLKVGKYRRFILEDVLNWLKK